MVRKQFFEAKGWSDSNITNRFDFLSKRGVQPIVCIQGSHMQFSTAYFLTTDMKAGFICCWCNIMACIVSCCFSCSFRLMSNSFWQKVPFVVSIFVQEIHWRLCASLAAWVCWLIIISRSPRWFSLLFFFPILSITFFLMSSALSLSFVCWTDRLSSGLMVSCLSINSSIRTSFSVRSSTTTPLAAASSLIFDLNFRRSNTQRSVTSLLSLLRNCGESIWFILPSSCLSLRKPNKNGRYLKHESKKVYSRFVDNGKLAVLTSARREDGFPPKCKTSTGKWFDFRSPWTDKICLALSKISTKFVSAKFLICLAWAHWITAKYLLTTSVNHMEINTIACALSIWLHVVDKRALVLVLGWLGGTYGCTNWAELGPGDAAGTLT